jgi:hypothetical protein
MRKASKCLVLAAVILASASGSAFSQQEEDEDTFEQKIIKKILGGVGVDVGRPRIEYRDRSPLVIPPNRDLPPPESTGAVEHPNWPKDPDQQPRKTSGSKATQGDSIRQHDIDRATVSPRELEKGRVAGAGRVTEPKTDAIDNASEYGGRPLPPSKLGTKKLFGWSLFGSKGEEAPFTQEPERSSLTQPPPGYQTPSANYPYGLSQGQTPTIQSMPEIKDPGTK